MPFLADLYIFLGRLKAVISSHYIQLYSFILLNVNISTKKFAHESLLYVPHLYFCDDHFLLRHCYFFRAFCMVVYASYFAVVAVVSDN